MSDIDDSVMAYVEPLSGPDFAHGFAVLAQAIVAEREERTDTKKCPFCEEGTMYLREGNDPDRGRYGCNECARHFDEWQPNDTMGENEETAKTGRRVGRIGETSAFSLEPQEPATHEADTPAAKAERDSRSPTVATLDRDLENSYKMLGIQQEQIDELTKRLDAADEERAALAALTRRIENPHWLTDD